MESLIGKVYVYLTTLHSPRLSAARRLREYWIQSWRALSQVLASLLSSYVTLDEMKFLNLIFLFQSMNTIMVLTS